MRAEHAVKVYGTGDTAVRAAFSIYNTFSILAAQRGRESALLRALGGTRRRHCSWSCSWSWARSPVSWPESGPPAAPPG